MKTLLRTFALSVLAALPACALSSAKPDVPAVITHPTAQSRTELQHAVSAALHGSPVRLADDALTQDPLLVIDREQPKDAQGMPLNGRELGKPEQFRLVRQGTACVLIHESTGKRQRLKSATCEAAPAAVPQAIKAPSGEHLILRAQASGAQVYTCHQEPDGRTQWVLKGPDAQLHDDQGAVIIHHFAGPTWQHVDGSQVTGKAVAKTDAPEPNSVPWLLLNATGHDGHGILSDVTSIQRVRTKGGQPPAASECDATKVNSEVRSAYTAEYDFYAPTR